MVEGRGVLGLEKLLVLVLVYQSAFGEKCSVTHCLKTLNKPARLSQVPSTEITLSYVRHPKCGTLSSP